METRAIVELVAQAFADNNTAGIVKHLAEDAEWHMLGDSVITGKANIQKFFNDHPDIKAITCTQDRFIVDGNQASVSGEVQCQDGNGKVFDMYYCDIYELLNGKVKKMITYGVMKK